MRVSKREKILLILGGILVFAATYYLFVISPALARQKELDRYILRKETGLSRSERHIIELHPEFSVRILATSKYFNRMLHAIRDHHERLDGSGYPRGLTGNDISLEAQIIAVCDTFDAMNSDRPYRKALAPTKAINEVLARPEQYNHTITLALKRILKEEGRLKAESTPTHNK